MGFRKAVLFFLGMVALIVGLTMVVVCSYNWHVYGKDLKVLESVKHISVQSQIKDMKGKKKKAEIETYVAIGLLAFAAIDLSVLGYMIRRKEKSRR